MICMTVVLMAKDAADIPRIRGLLATHLQQSRAEPGCLRFDVYHSQAEPRRFLLVEHWADQAALDVHRLAAAATTIYKPQVLPLVDRDGHPSDLIG